MSEYSGAEVGITFLPTAVIVGSIFCMRHVKTVRQLERHFKGIANHWRIDILLFVAAHQGASVDDIAVALRGRFKTISEHTRRLVVAGLLDKKYQGRSVVHALSPYGFQLVDLITTFQHS